MEKFNFTMPAEIVKSKDGEYKIAGLASTEDLDQQNEIIIQKGIDLTPVDEGKGFFNFDHSNRPEDLIGVVDGYHRNANGLYVHGKLFKGHQRAEAVYAIMKGLEATKKGAVGLSVEGQIIERDTKNPKIIKKCRIRNIAVTFNPVNKNTYANLMKSMAVDTEVEFDTTETQLESIEQPSDITKNEPTFTVSQVMAIVQKALSVGAGSNQAPADMKGGDALTQESLDKDEPKKKKKMRKMEKSLYKSSLVKILDQLQVLYPEYSRSEIWEAVKDRLDTKFPEVFGKAAIRLKRESASEREHKLFEEARQRSDYEENKDKSPAQLAEIARQSGAEKREQQKIKAQVAAARQVGEKDYVRPFVKR